MDLILWRHAEAALPRTGQDDLQRPLTAACWSSPFAPRNKAEISTCNPELRRASLSKLNDILSFSIFDSVEVVSPVRRLTSASVQPCWMRKALSAAPGLASDLSPGN